MRHIDQIIIHCTATPRGRAVSVSDIDRWHRERGFDCIGYHFVVLLDGTIAMGRPIEKVGAHCKLHNRRSIGIAYVGGVEADCKTPSDTRTNAQKESLDTLIRLLKQHYPQATVHSHSDFAAKACPSFDATREYAHI